jgi:hypothetical protein
MTAIGRVNEVLVASFELALMVQATRDVTFPWVDTLVVEQTLLANANRVE